MDFKYKGHSVAVNTSLQLVPDNTRGLFYWLILAISVFALIGNGLAVRSIIGRKWKFLKKTCLMSLAIADIFSVSLFAINNLEILSNRLMVWTLGEFMCYFVPMGQVLGITAGSLALLIIALDRYQNITFSTRWDPNPGSCIVFAIALFLICGVISYPMFTFFDYKAIWILHLGPYSKKPVFEFGHMCIATIKERLTIYYLIMAILIFIPMLVIFVWFYFSIALLIWTHRKPLSSKYDKEPEVDEPSTCSSKLSNSASSAHNNLHPILKKKKENIQFEKKICSLRIVIVLVISFVSCRLPYWCYYAVRLVGKLQGGVIWNINFSLLALNLLNCALDPLLYTFLGQTINALKMFNDLLCKVCCIGGINDDFEKNNPFKNLHQKNQVNVTMIKPNCKVTFIDASPHIPHITLQK